MVWQYTAGNTKYKGRNLLRKMPFGCHFKIFVVTIIWSFEFICCVDCATNRFCLYIQYYNRSNFMTLFVVSRQAAKNFRTIAMYCVLVAVFVVQAPFSHAAENGKAFTISDKVGKNQIQFVSKAPLEDITGTASDIAGTISIDPAHFEKTTGKIEVKVKSMETGIKKRDGHLFSEAWLDAEKFPAIVFAVQGLSDVRQVKNESGMIIVEAKAAGEFTMHGVTKKISIPVKITYMKESEKTRQRAQGDFVLVQGDFDIALADFNVEGTKGTVGSKVGKTIQISASFYSSNGL